MFPFIKLSGIGNHKLRMSKNKNTSERESAATMGACFQK